MIDPNKVTAAVMEFMQNPTWKEIFTNAPGGAMERIAISFYFSKFHDQFQPEDFQEYRDLRDEYEKSLTEEDLNYLIENSEKENAKKHYQELLEKLQQNGGQPQGNMRFEKNESETRQQPQNEEKENQNATEEQPVIQGEESTEKVEEPVQGDEKGQENVEETVAETTEEKTPTIDDGLPPIDNTFAKQDEEDGKQESTEEDSKERKSDSEENQEQDEKYNTALSVALNYLQNEENQIGGTEDNDEKKK